MAKVYYENDWCLIYTLYNKFCMEILIPSGKKSHSGEDIFYKITHLFYKDNKKIVILYETCLKNFVSINLIDDEIIY